MTEPAKFKIKPLAVKQQKTQRKQGGAWGKATYTRPTADQLKAALKPQQHPIKLVQLEGLALLKIIRHCDEAIVGTVFGTLLGLPSGGGTTLEITDCYRVKEAEGEVEYQQQTLKCLGDLGVDNYNVGWYGCAFYNDFFFKKTALQQFQSQEEIPFSVFLVYDPISTRHGRLALRAFRLKENVMNLFRKNLSGGKEMLSEASISTHDVFDEIPIVLKNHPLVHGFLFDLKQSRAININCASLAMHNEDDISDLMSRGGDVVDRYKKEQETLKKYLRDEKSWESQRQAHIKNAKNNPRLKDESGKVDEEKATRDFETLNPKPVAKDRLDSVLSTTLMHSQSNEMLEVVNNDFLRMWVTKGL